VVVTIALGWWFVGLTGGVQYSSVHVMYVPVIVAALVFGVPGAIVAGVAAGLAVGPLMALDTATGEAQATGNWLQRVVFFCLIGALVGVGAGLLRRHTRYLAWINDHHPATGLLTERGLIRRLEEQLATSSGPDGPVVLVLQLNNLLDIHNTLGAAFGERLVQAVCDRGRQAVPGEYPLALIQTDRLAVVFASATEMTTVRKHVDDQMRAPYEIDGVEIYVDLVYGAASAPTHASTAVELLQKASIALHVAATRGLPWFVYEAQSDATSRENLVLLGTLLGAVQRDELTLWHQAKTCLASGDVTGTEALIRWNHPQHGLVMPGRFMPQVEASPLIDQLTWWVVDAAVRDVARWRLRGCPITVSVNVSVRNLHNRMLVGVLDEALARHGVEPAAVDVEITESAVMGDFDRCVELIGRLRDRGFSVSIDDFGTGHSSLAYLKQLPVTKLKIDQEFIRRLATDSRDQQITRTIIDLAAGLGLESVAEGVEDRASVDMLREWGCDYAQGNFLHPASPFDDFIAWFEHDRGRRDHVGA
jgi:EAL domain-containing protein (putative c-di-GMP-specific phosphodiesterase class I)